MAPADLERMDVIALINFGIMHWSWLKSVYGISIKQLLCKSQWTCAVVLVYLLAIETSNPTEANETQNWLCWLEQLAYISENEISIDPNTSNLEYK